MYYKQGDIVIVPFPFTNLTSTKKRPAIVVSNDIVNRSADVILAQITTKPVSHLTACKVSNNDVSIPFNPPHSEMNISCKKIAVIEKRLITKKITELSNDYKLTEVLDKIIQVFEKQT